MFLAVFGPLSAVMDEIEKAKEDILVLVAEIAETDDQNVPVLLLGLKGTDLFYFTTWQLSILNGNEMQ